MSPALRPLVDQAAAPYRRSGRFAWHFARGKLGHDPVFPALLQLGLFAQSARVTDVGCGQGLLAHWLAAAAALAREGQLPPDFANVAPYQSYHGIELAHREVERARASGPPRARFDCIDMRAGTFEPAERIVMLDVLHYIPPADQRAVLGSVKKALAPGGRFILRVGDAGAGWRARRSQLTDRLVMFARGRGWGPLHCHPLAAWMRLLQEAGFSVDAMPSPDDDDAFANRLLILRHTA